MARHPINEELERELETLAPELQQRVLDFAHSLATQPPRGARGHELLRFAGAVDPDDARTMTEAIDEACEQVHPHEW
jgi:hypothetical protein